VVTAWIALGLSPGAATAQATLTLRSPSGIQAEPPWLGLLRPRQGLYGVQVVEVYEDSGAAAGGLLAGDEILFIDDVPVTTVNELVMIVQQHQVEDVVTVQLVRGGQELALPVKLGARVDDREMLHRRLVGKPAPSARLRRLDDDRVLDPSALRGKVAVLAWFSTRCDTCGEIISDLSSWTGNRRDAVVMAVTSAEPTLVSTYLTRSAISVPVAVTDDEDFVQYSLLGGKADAMVAFVVIDRNGVVRMAAAVGAGDEPGEATATVDDVIAGARQLLRSSRR
jgi:PDZ domain/Redoxin